MHQIHEHRISIGFDTKFNFSMTKWVKRNLYYIVKRANRQNLVEYQNINMEYGERNPDDDLCIWWTMNSEWLAKCPHRKQFIYRWKTATNPNYHLLMDIGYYHDHHEPLYAVCTYVLPLVWNTQIHKQFIVFHCTFTVKYKIHLPKIRYTHRYWMWKPKDRRIIYESR